MAKLLIQRLNRASSAKWVLADQIAVSALNFATGILLARFLGVEAYGKFVISYSALLYANTLQQALIVAPMLSTAPQLEGSEQERYLRGMLASQIALSIFLFAIALLSINIVNHFTHSWNFLAASFPLSLSIVFFQLQDWLRRYYFISRKARSALINDVVSYGGQVLALTILFKAKALSIDSAFWAIAMTSASAFVIGIAVEKLHPLRQQILQTFQKSWRSSLNLFLAGQVNWLGSQGILVLSGLILGPQALGGLRAAQNIAGPFSILFQGMENFVPIKASQTYAQNQLKGLVHFLFKVSCVGGIILVVPSIIISIFSKNLTILAYGREYSDYSYLVIWQLAICLVAFLCFQGFYFFRTVDETHQILFGSIISSFISASAAIVLGSLIGTVGIMASILLGQFGYIAYFTLVISKHLKNAGIKPI
ncbi:MAG: oligosaccharide flippase family protein [Plectolyngbya sp. WJT66-NPBG17]|nr:oligosaccharide flippase family protein [Plectolyngbya sp. WJT66-NPBG17]